MNYRKAYGKAEAAIPVEWAGGYQRGCFIFL